MAHPEFYYRSIAYIENALNLFSAAEKVFSDRDKSESFANYMVMHSVKYRDEGFSCSSEFTEFFTERVSFRKITSIIFKVSVHYIFRLMYCLKNNTKYQSSVLVKTWIELNYTTYASKVNDAKRSLVLVFPFPLGFRRQFRYIMLLKKTGVKFCFYGAGYSLKDLFLFLLNRDMGSLFNLEYNASRKILGDFIKYSNLVEYLVMDDVDPFANVVNKSLDARGVRVVCTMHGIGTYSPFYFASEVNLFNQAQADYYRYFRPNLVVNIKHSAKPLVLPVSFDRIVFYSGVSMTTGNLITMVELRVFNLIYKLCKRNNICLQVKVHPNSQGIKLYDNVDNFDGTESDNTLNLSLYSTSYYTVCFGSSVLIETEEIPTSLLFGEAESIIKEAHIKRLLFEKR